MSTSSKIKPPLSPKLVLAIAIVLPGMGQLLNNAPTRGLLMVSFMFILGYMTSQVADPSVSMVGRYAGGFFVYQLKVFHMVKTKCVMLDIASIFYIPRGT